MQTPMESELSPLTSHEVAQAVVLDGEQRSKLIAYARARFGLKPEDAEDLLQETALELLRQQTIVRSPLGFTFRVFHRRCCRFIRLRQADRQVFVSVEEPVETACDAAPLEAADRQITLRRVLETVSSSCRRILLAYYMEGRSLKETAQAIPTPYPAVWNTISRCLRRLRACLT
jgi:RNA polymerase sigma factor (sigma-70 family)